MFRKVTQEPRNYKLRYLFQKTITIYDYFEKKEIATRNADLYKIVTKFVVVKKRQI